MQKNNREVAAATHIWTQK